MQLLPGNKKKESVVEVLAPIAELEGFENKIKFYRKSMFSSFTSPTEVAKQSFREYGVPKL